jgi:hypothetical protein
MAKTSRNPNDGQPNHEKAVWSDAQRVRTAHLLMRAMLAEEVEAASLDLGRVTLAALAGALVLSSAPSAWPLAAFATVDRPR